MRRNGFTLIELSIVLVIIGLIVAGVTAGQSLIESARLQKVAADVNDLKSSINAFRLKYNELPGDFPEAQDYWSGSNIVNGDGNGRITGLESRYVWKHMSYAELVKGDFKFSGITPATMEEGFPESPFDDGFYFFNHWTAFGDNNSIPFHAISLAPNVSGSGTGPLTGEQAASLDKKMDDGDGDSGAVGGLCLNDEGTSDCRLCYTGSGYILTSGAVCNQIYWFDGSPGGAYDVSM